MRVLRKILVYVVLKVSSAHCTQVIRKRPESNFLRVEYPYVVSSFKYDLSIHLTEIYVYTGSQLEHLSVPIPISKKKIRF